MSDNVQVERRGAIAIVSLNRPEARNAVDEETADALRQAFLAIEKDEQSQIAILTGRGGAFCSGWDLKNVAVGDSLNLKTPSGQALDPNGPMGPTRLQLSKPVIAAIEGPAVAGGMELALWCDLRVMARSSYMGVFNRRWGVPLIDGGTARLPRLIGESRAMDLILTGRKVGADEAFAFGLANRIAEDGASLQTAMDIAEGVAAFPPCGVLSDWKNARDSLDGDFAAALAREFTRGAKVIESGESARGAARFARGKGRGGDFDDI